MEVVCDSGKTRDAMKASVLVHGAEDTDGVETEYLLVVEGDSDAETAAKSMVSLVPSREATFEEDGT